MSGLREVDPGWELFDENKRLRKELKRHKKVVEYARDLLLAVHNGHGEITAAKKLDRKIAELEEGA